MIAIRVIEGTWELKAFLHHALPCAHKGTVERALRNRDIKRDGQRLGARDIVRAGDRLEVFIADEYLKPEIAILYEDALLVAVDKPRGLLSVGKGSMEECVQALYPGARACHRLDSATCGALLFARTDEAYDEALRLFKERRMSKRYRCLVIGEPPQEGELSAYLTKDARQARVAISDRAVPGSLPVALAYCRLEARAEEALLMVELFTGRTHQIRAQMAHAGHPIVGDDAYGDRSYNRAHGARHLMLQSTELGIQGAQGALAALNGLVIRAKILPGLMTAAERLARENGEGPLNEQTHEDQNGD